MAKRPDLGEIPGIGTKFQKDLARIGIIRIAQLRKKSAEAWFEQLSRVNAAADHTTSKNYLYVLRMAVYFAKGGREPAKLKWSAWSDARLRESARPRAKDGREMIELSSRQELRRWLTANHERSRGVWIVLHKKAAGPKRFTPEDLCEELVCVGWVDSRPGKLDARRSLLLCTPRRAQSAWSSLNKKRYARMEAAGKLRPAGRLAKDIATENGRWDALNAIEALIVPEDLAAALARKGGAARHFAAFPPSAQRGILEWIAQAKRPETRSKRVKETADLAAKNVRANQWPRA